MKRRIFLFLLIIFISLRPQSVWGQGEVLIDYWAIKVLPEYDRPDILVINQITLTPETNLPASLSLYIPEKSGGPFTVAYRDVDGFLYNLDYEAERQGEWIKVTFETLMPTIQVEYYDPRLHHEQAHRSYDFKWKTDTPVNTLSLMIQQPVNARFFVITPEMSQSEARSHELSFYTQEIRHPEIGKTISYNLSYEKSNNLLSAGYESVQPVQALPEPGSGKPGIQVDWFPASVWVPILGLLGVLLIVLGLFLYNTTNIRKISRFLPQRLIHSADTMAEEYDTYCHHCGKKTLQGDQYCRSCGTRLRNVPHAVPDLKKSTKPDLKDHNPKNEHE